MWKESNHMENEKLNLAVNSILSTWQQGRRVLVVLGAGASISAGIPDMTAVFRELKTSIEVLKDEFEGYPESEQATNEKPKIKERLIELCNRLNALAVKNAPRSVAAMALGTLQRSHLQITEKEGQKWLYSQLSNIWTKFSKRFVNGDVVATSEDGDNKNCDSSGDIIALRKQIATCTLAHRIKKTQIRPVPPLNCSGPLTSRDPSPLHYCVAGWALEGWADIISLNFDGLTREALNRCAKGREFVPVVLTEPKALQNYFLGNAIQQDNSKHVVPVVKVWGDVFHAVCTSQQCPEFGNKIAIYELAASKFHEGCPSCHAPRQLQIFFTGYEEKERTTNELMRGLLKYVAPRIGCIVTIGFSGLWDQTLVRACPSGRGPMLARLRSCWEGNMAG
jgi:NAD-dependent SIR2 family protein deacetylase